MTDQNKSDKKNQIIGTVKYISGILGILGVIIAILTITKAVNWIIIEYTIPVQYGASEQLVLSLASSVIGIFFLFIAFSNQIDKFFGFLGSHEVKTDKNKESSGISFESIFFFVIAIILLVLAIMLSINFLTLRTELPLLGGATRTVLIISLVILTLLALFTAFNNIIMQSINEMKKVQWPSNKNMIDYSKKVFSFIIFFSLFFLALDFVIAYAPILVENIFHIDL